MSYGLLRSRRQQLLWFGVSVLGPEVLLGRRVLEHGAWDAAGDNTTEQALLAAMNKTAESALKGLRAAADDSVEEHVAKVQATENFSSLEGEVSLMLKGQEEVLKQQAPQMEVNLERVRQALSNAKFEKANQAEEVAVRAAREVQEENEQNFAVLQQVGTSLASEAHKTYNDVTGSHASVMQRNAAASSLQSSFVAAAGKANKALRGTTQSLQLIQEQAKAVERTARLIDNSAAQTLTILAEARRHAVNASEIALMAVNQATQNALKLKMVQMSVAESTRATMDAAQQLSVGSL